MILAHGAVAAALLACAVPASAQVPAEFRFFKPIPVEITQEEIVQARLDTDVYKAARDGYPDMRVFDGDGREVPFHFERAMESQFGRSRRLVPSHIVSLKEEGEALEIVVHSADGSPPVDVVEIVTPLADYERKVTVYGADDGGPWKELVSDGPLFDYSRYIDFRQREVELPRNECTRFRLAIDAATDQVESPLRQLERTIADGRESSRIVRSEEARRPLKIDRLRLWNYVEEKQAEKPVKAVYKTSGFRVEQDAKVKRTLVYVDTNREPLTSLRIETPARNFFRRAKVEVPVTRGVATEWKTIGEATIERLRFRTLSREQLSVRFPEERHPQYRITIENEDNPPLEVSAIAAEGNVFRVVFLAQPRGVYRLAYGSTTAERARYETSAVMAALGRGFDPVAAQLGPQSRNRANSGAEGWSFRQLLDNGYVLGGAVVLMVVVLAYALVRAGQKIDTTAE